ncbi:hypothetical protein CR513_16220, partial [Mucuna pruriens]
MVLGRLCSLIIDGGSSANLNRFSFVHIGQKVVLKTLSPREDKRKENEKNKAKSKRVSGKRKETKKESVKEKIKRESGEEESLLVDQELGSWKLSEVIARYSRHTTPITNTSNSVEYNSTNNFSEPEQIENNDRTLKELATTDVVYQPWCIQYPQLEPAQSYELKSDLIHLLPKFHGLAREDPHKHLKEFHVVCSIMRPQGISEDYIKMKAFPFSLDGATKNWLYLQSILFNTWGDIKRMFLEKFFPASRTATITKEICRIRKHSRETLHEY